MPVFFEDIRTLNVSTDLFFGALSVDLKSTDINPPPIRFLKKGEARRARRIITGLMVCQRDKIPLAGLSTKEVVKMVEKLTGETLG